MKCYRCKKPDLTSAMRVLMPAKNGREKDAFRNICEDCYPIVMHEKGYELVNGIWRHATVLEEDDEDTEGAEEWDDEPCPYCETNSIDWLGRPLGYCAECGRPSGA